MSVRATTMQATSRRLWGLSSGGFAMIGWIGSCGLAMVGLLGCSSAPRAGDGANDVTIVDEEAPPPVPEAETPSTDPQVTCLRVADRLASCTIERAKLVLGDLPADERAQAETVIQQAAEGIERLRGYCRAELADEDVTYVQAMGRCLPLACPALRSCVDQTQ